MPQGIYPNELDTYVHRETCTQMFIAALFIIAKILRNQEAIQLKKKMDKETVVYSDNGIWFSDKKKWAIEPWKDLEEH